MLWLHQLIVESIIFAVSRQGPKIAFPARISKKNICFTCVMVALALLTLKIWISKNLQIISEIWLIQIAKKRLL